MFQLLVAAFAAPGASPTVEGSRGDGRMAPRTAVSATAPRQVAQPIGRSPSGRAVVPPRSPPGVPPCVETLQPSRPLPGRVGETVRYIVDVNGISVGIVDFKIERRGSYQREAVTEYRSLFKIDKLVSTIVPVQGRAAALVPQTGFAPRVAMNRFRLADNTYREDVTYADGGRIVASTRAKNDSERSVRRAFAGAVPDFVTAFYMLRRMPAAMRGCLIIYGNQRAYTVWVEPAGRDEVKTPVGRRTADRYTIRYGSERARRAVTGTLWLAADAERMPYRAELRGTNRLDARIHMYEPGDD